MLALWTQDEPRYAGRFVAFDGVKARPRPLQKPHPPIVVGGASAPAYRRALRHGNGWYGFGLDPEGTEKCLAGLRDAAQQVERPDALGPLEITVTPARPLDRDGLRRFEDLGVQRIVSLMRGRDESRLLRFVETLAKEVG
jgi:alkanesulfonate monooxygenase SsuD/methylene tetrahydromethanopterin reductase-like flavin-dependent oxidoreductase (luciferase family)